MSEQDVSIVAAPQLPYSDRQLIIVTEDALAQAARQEERIVLQQQQNGIDWRKIGEAVLRDVVPIPFGGVILELSREAVRAWGKARESGVKVLAIGKTEASTLKFPPGHPRDTVIYVGHPALVSVYHPMADFHRVTFEHKFCEAVELLMSLGATKLRVEHVRGWSKEFSGRLSLPLPVAGGSGKAEASARADAESKMLYEATLSNSAAPSIPRETVWFPHEPTWQAIAKGRLQYGLQDFSLTVTYDDDFGVNAGLKLAVVKTGLDIGGKFEDHQATVWKIQGKFGSPSARGKQADKEKKDQVPKTE